MTDSDQERLWKEDAEQLKEDLDNRKKNYKKREVPLSFGGIKKKENKTTKKDSINTDDWTRKQLGL
jgi:hypothetical protein